LDFEPVGLDWLTIATCWAVDFFLPGLAATEVDGAASCFDLRLVDAGDWVWGATVLDDCPRLPGVVWAGFGAAFRNLTAEVGWAAFDLRLVFNLAEAWASSDVGVDLARERLALGDGCSAVDKEGAVDWLPIRPRTSVATSLNITDP
jgi:hypothetical protein